MLFKIVFLSSLPADFSFAARLEINRCNFALDNTHVRIKNINKIKGDDSTRLSDRPVIKKLKVAAIHSCGVIAGRMTMSCFLIKGVILSNKSRYVSLFMRK